MEYQLEKDLFVLKRDIKKLSEHVASQTETINQINEAVKTLLQSIPVHHTHIISDPQATYDEHTTYYYKN